MKQVSSFSLAGQTSEEQQPGRLIKMYRTRVTREGMIYFLLILLLFGLLTGVCAWSLVSNLIEAPLRSHVQLVPPFFFTLFMWVLYAIGQVRGMRRHERMVTPLRVPIHVYLHAEGFVYREGRQLRVIRWEQIESVQRQVGKSRGKLRYSYLLRLRDGSEMTLRGIIADVQELGSAIEREVVDYYWPSTLTKYRNNDSLLFNGLCVTRQQLVDGAKRLSWDQVSEIRSDQGKLIVKVKGSNVEWLSMPVSLIPNLCLLERLLTYMKLRENLDMQLIV